MELSIELPKITININDGDDVDCKIMKWFTDGSTLKNGKDGAKGGYAAICVGGHMINNIIVSNIFDDTPTNIKAEALAIIAVFEVLEKSLDSDDWHICIIYTDSMFWINMIYKYMPKWSNEKFDTQANPQLTKKIWALWQKFKYCIKIIKLVHVPAHNKKNTKNSKNLYDKFCYDNNNCADILANWAASSLDANTYYKIE